MLEKPTAGVESAGRTAHRITVLQAPPIEQARTSTWAESPRVSQRVESTSHSSRRRFWRAKAVTVSPRHRRSVAAVSTVEPLLKRARMRGRRFRTTARFPAVTAGTTSVTVGAVPESPFTR